MEGTAYALQHNLQTAEKAGVFVSELRATGGSANSVLWTQIKADVTGKKILVSGSDTATPLGAAILAGVGCGYYRDFEEAVRQTVRVKRVQEPDETHREAYRHGFGRYIALYEALKGQMQPEDGR